MLETNSTLDFVFFGILEYLHLHNELSWGWEPSLNTKFISVSCIPYTQSLRVLHTIFLSYSILTMTCLSHEVRSEIFHFCCHDTQDILDFGTFGF